MASAQVCRYNATQRNKLKFRSVSLTKPRYDRVTEKAAEYDVPRVVILEFLVDNFLDEVKL